MIFNIFDIKTAQVTDAQSPNPEPPEEPGVYSIPESRLGWLQQKIFALNKVAKKIGVQPIEVKELSREYKDDPGDETGLSKITFYKIKIIGAVPLITSSNGQNYEFMGRITHTSEGNIIATAPGKSLPESFRNVEPICQHCMKKRRRNDTFVLRNPEDNSLTQVGRNCLKDFTNNESVESIAKWAELVFSLNEEVEHAGDEGGGGGGPRGYEIERFLEIVSFIINKYGWVPKSKADQLGKTPTVENVFSLLSNRKEFEKEYKAPSAEEKGVIKDALEWVKGLKNKPESETETLSDYLWNLSIACSQPIVEYRNAGIVASLLIAYKMNVLDKIAPSAKEIAGNRGSHFVDSVTILKENPSGDETNYVAKTNDNKIVSWWGKPLQSEIGTLLNIEGFVSGFKRGFEGIITNLVGVKALNDEEAATKKQEVEKEKSIGPQVPEYKEGDKFTTDVVVLSHKTIPNQFTGGDQEVYNFSDRAGTTLSWFTSGSINLEVGESANITATVKKITSYQGKPQIQITRAKINSKTLREGEQDNRMSAKELKALKQKADMLEQQRQSSQENSAKSQEQIQELNKVVYEDISNAVSSVIGFDIKTKTGNYYYHWDSIFNLDKMEKSIQDFPDSIIRSLEGQISRSREDYLDKGENYYVDRFNKGIQQQQQRILELEQKVSELQAIVQAKKDSGQALSMWDYDVRQLNDNKKFLDYLKNEMSIMSNFDESKEPERYSREGSQEWLAFHKKEYKKSIESEPKLLQEIELFKSKKEEIISAALNTLNKHKPEIEKLLNLNKQYEDLATSSYREMIEIQRKIQTAKDQEKQYGKKAMFRLDVFKKNGSFWNLK